MTNISTHHSNTTLSRSQGAALSRSGARVLLHTAAALSMASPRRIETGRERKKRTAVPTNARAFLPVAQRQQQGRKVRQSGVRIRERAQEPEAARLSAPKDSKGRKGRSVQQGRPAGGRTGSTPSEGSRRQQRRTEMALLDDLARAHDRQGRDAPTSSCTRENSIPVDRNNFTSIKDDLAGCYRLAENIGLQSDRAPDLPIGNRSHPFTGSLESDGHSLSVNLTRSLGDAVLFGAIDHSRLNLTVIDSRLETANGSRAALIGTMGSDNQVLISRLSGNLFNATGEGIVEAGLVARTTGAGNRLELSDALKNTWVARSFSGSGSHRAQVSLGLGVIEASGKQFVSQHRLEDNQLYAVTLEQAAQGRPESGNRTALAGLLGLLDAGSGTGQILKSHQQAVHKNQMTAFAHSSPEDGGISCASLGYSGVDCGRHTEATHWSRTLQVSQADCKDNAVFPWVARPLGNRSWTGDELSQDGLARASLVSTEPVFRLNLLHRDIGPDQLQAQAGVVQRALLPPTSKATVILVSGGDDSVPLFGNWGGEQDCAISKESWSNFWLAQGASLLDSAGYRAEAFNCQQNGAALRYDTVNNMDWRIAHGRFSAFDQGFSGRPPNALWGYYTAALHYPHERLQSLTLIPLASWLKPEWQLVTRQSYPWQPDRDAEGLLRRMRYRPPRAPGALPERFTPSPLAFTLYSPQRGDAPLHKGPALQGMQAYSRSHLFQLYQGPGQPAQLVETPRLFTDGNYRLAQYDRLPGRARLLSMEQGEVHLWMQQQDSDSLLVYGLGASAPASNTTTRLHWRLDMSEQPGGQVQLARHGDWLYSVRQEVGQPASLRRWYCSKGPAWMDRQWRPDWPGNVTDGQHLVVDKDHLVALPTGTLIDPWQRDTGFQAQVPFLGGPLHWQRIALTGYPLPPASCCPASPGGATDSSSVTPEPSQGHSSIEEGLKGAAYAASAIGAVVVINSLVIGALCRKHRRRAAEREAFDARQLAEQQSQVPVPVVTTTLTEETAV